MRKLGGQSARDRRLFAERGPEAGDEGGGGGKGGVTLGGRGEQTDSDGGERDRGRGGSRQRLPELSAAARCARREAVYATSVCVDAYATSV